MATRMGGSALRWSRDEAARRLRAIETEIRRILEEFPDFRRRRPAQARRGGMIFQRRRTAAKTRLSIRVVQ